MNIPIRSDDSVVNLALNTIENKKQALVFVNAKRSAEKVAEDIAKALKLDILPDLSEQILNVLSKPTKQCERLAKCVKRGVAFHHSGLHSKQKELIEDSFRSGLIKIICCTPTLAAGVDLPAFRAIIRDVKRFGNHGMQPIPVLEFLQMAGRAGRPKYDSYGEAIVTVNSESERDWVVDEYLHGFPEAILSKLAVEPVLRTYLLSLISSRVISSRESIIDFFSRSFWAFQYKDINRISVIIDKMLKLLVEWGFLQSVQEGFRATLIGRRVAELYLDPLTAFDLLRRLERASHSKVTSFGLLQSVCFTLELRPLLRVKQREYEEFQDQVARLEAYVFDREPSMFDGEYDDWLSSFKTALMLEDWISEKDEEWILEHYDCRPGELHVKVDRADWLLYACSEFSKLMQYQNLLNEITKVRLRLKYGVKEELLTLIKLEGIGRVRARKLHHSGFKDMGDIRKATVEQLAIIVGDAVAKKLKKQV